MGKFKIIEEGRMLNPDEQNDVKAGFGCNKYSECGIIGGYVTCMPGSAAYGFETTCDTITMFGHGVTCNTSHAYLNCTGRKYVSCPAGKTYSN